MNIHQPYTVRKTIDAQPARPITKLVLGPLTSRTLAATYATIINATTSQGYVKPSMKFSREFPLELDCKIIPTTTFVLESNHA